MRVGITRYKMSALDTSLHPSVISFMFCFRLCICKHRSSRWIWGTKIPILLWTRAIRWLHGNERRSWSDERQWVQRKCDCAVESWQTALVRQTSCLLVMFLLPHVVAAQTCPGIQHGVRSLSGKHPHKYCLTIHVLQFYYARKYFLNWILNIFLASCK